MGAGLLAIWSDVETAGETDYLHWLTREHAAERVGLPGFEGVRVCRAELEGTCRYLILYDLASPAVLTSPDYLARLNAPTPWSRRIMPTLRNFARGGGRVVGERGSGRGGHLLALRLSRAPDGWSGALDALAAGSRICAVRLLAVDQAGTAVRTNERALRERDESFPGLLLIEATDGGAARDALSHHAGAVAALGAEVETPVTYSVRFVLGKAVARAAGAPGGGGDM